MRQYDLYIIEDLFAIYFYGREQMFFQLFKECHESGEGIKDILIKQVEYITKPIPTKYIYSHILQELGKRTDLIIKRKSFLIVNKRGDTELFLEHKKLHVKSSGDMFAEFIFMDTLKSLDIHFFALDLENERFGWLKPLKDRKYVK
ncbi:sporulation inhibitor of replication protein SirA [Fervidibacillus halotolerans]|uniref:Sporulation inhibitor of replication protein SirA n=1 Tax=Fervidibacillus halotolerans TaxID=2980027 RepID=A0A9E8M1G9_9BACI|nr:sporulation inhibitor of replication protein SirA [Fervidibacillus halotolerans]WAA13504.1 sporulation inhibitor of replication protein SirA [Fervidibacillus halotolerans]